MLFEMAKEEAMGYLGDLYNEADYPMDITESFGLNGGF